MENDQKNNFENDQEISLKSDDKALEGFSDLSGITVKNLNFGLWWVQNSKNVKRLAFLFLMAIGGLAWLYTLASFGYYLSIGMNKDNQMLSEMAQQTKSVHQYVLANAPHDVEVGELQAVALNDQVDLVVPVVNPNDRYYAHFTYVLESSGQEIFRGNDFVLPNETKNITILGLKSAEAAGRLQVRLESTSWQRVDSHKIVDWSAYRNERVNFLVEDALFRRASDSGLTENLNLGQIEFNITNNTAYNYFKLPLQIFLKSYNRVVGLTSANLDNFSSGEKRLVKINFSGLASDVDQVEVVPNLDITRSDIYNKFSTEAK